VAAVFRLQKGIVWVGDVEPEGVYRGQFDVSSSSSSVLVAAHVII
jgi:hypothetical protein